MKRKTAVILMCMMLVLVGVLTACSNSNNQNDPPNNTGINGQGGNQAIEEPLMELSLPIVSEPLEIDYWRPNDPKLTASLNHFGEMAAYKKKEELTGIKVNFVHPPLGQQQDQFNLLVATNDMPDVIYFNWGAAVGGPEKMLADGKIIRLNEYIDQYAPNLKKLIENDEDIRKQISLDDGTIYMFPYLRSDSLKLNATSGLIIRKDWLDKLGLEVPTTIDDWYTVLKAFREKDPNGNGLQDELPFTGNWGPGHLGTLNLFAPAFGVTGFMLKDGKMVYGHIQPEYKQFLETMKKWYEEGLIDPEIMINDGATFDYKITNNLAGAYHGGVFSGMGKYFNLVKESNPEFDLTGTPWPIGPAGKPYANFWMHGKVLAYGEAITSSANEDIIPSIVQWMDFNYSPEGHMLFNFGIEGESYVVEGDTIKFTDKIMNNPKLTYDQALATYALSIMDGPMDQDGRYLDALMAFDGQKAANEVWMTSDDSLILPSLRFTEDEARQMASILTPITTYLDEMVTKFIMGNKPLSEFDEFVETIEKMGIEQIVKIHEDAYERYQTR